MFHICWLPLFERGDMNADFKQLLNVFSITDHEKTINKIKQGNKVTYRHKVIRVKSSKSVLYCFFLVCRKNITCKELG